MFTRYSLGMSQENLTMLHTNNKGEDQPALMRSLISTFVNCSLESTIHEAEPVLLCKVSIF